MPRRAANAELADQTALMQATLENMDQGLFMVDASGTIAIHNDRADELLSLPATLLDGKPHYHERWPFSTASANSPMPTAWPRNGSRTIRCQSIATLCEGAPGRQGA